MANRLIVFLLADIFGTQQWNVAFHRQMGDGGCGFGLGLIAFRAVPGGLIGCRIDLIKRLTCFDITSFNKVTLQDDTAHLGADFRHAKSRSAAWQFGGDRQRCTVHDMDRHLRRLCMGLRIARIIAAGKQQGRDN
ncbi:hypothetical protein QE409_004131 [Klebsiella sp. SORGH_AS 1173]|nr:hypothetical protein [Klebsiella sp. SORGH_AS_1173]